MVGEGGEKGKEEGEGEGEGEKGEAVWCTPKCSPGDKRFVIILFCFVFLYILITFLILLRVVIVGHSLGGSIAAKVVESGELQKKVH